MLPKLMGIAWEFMIELDFLQNMTKGFFLYKYEYRIFPVLIFSTYMLMQFLMKIKIPIIFTFFQADLDPQGSLHVKIELIWASQEEQSQPMRQFKETDGKYNLRIQTFKKNREIN